VLIIADGAKDFRVMAVPRHILQVFIAGGSPGDGGFSKIGWSNAWNKLNKSSEGATKICYGSTVPDSRKICPQLVLLTSTTPWCCL